MAIACAMQALTHCQHLVASSEARDVLYWVICPALYAGSPWQLKWPVNEVHFALSSIICLHTTGTINHVMIIINKNQVTAWL
jgi:hypothetical protein